MKYIYLFIGFSFMMQCSFAQQNVEFSKENFEDKAAFDAINIDYLDGLDYYTDENYALAIPFLIKAYDFNPNNAELNLKLGVCYLHTSEKHKAYKHLKLSYDIDPKYSHNIDYYFARAHHFLLEFEDAIIYYEKFIPTMDDPTIIAQIQKKIEECENGISLREKRAVGFVINLKQINSEYTDYSPMLSADQKTMVFTSRRNCMNNEIDPFDMQYHEKIFISHFQDNTWSEPVPISESINSKGHNANVGMSIDGQTLYVYDSHKGKSKIYKSTLEGSRWIEPVMLPEPINSKFNEKSISLSPDGKTVYFVSDRTNGIGGLDIYIADKGENDAYIGDAYNIGSVINTPYDEDGIYIHPDGKSLYFSSKGHNTMGGYDIFKSEKDSNGIWSEPINLGQPINSADDDIFLYVSADGKTGYFSSVREGGMGEKDIYKINFSEDEDNIDEKELVLVKGKVRDAITEMAVEADVVIVNNTTQEEVAKFRSNKETGEFIVSLPAGIDYGMTIINDDYLFYGENFNLVDSARFYEVELNMKLNKIAENSSAILRNIFFDYGKSILKPESEIEINRVYTLLNSHPEITIEIEGHTDNISSKRFNMALSKKRANAVANYLIEKGIDRKRFKTKGYGFSKPMESNDTELGRQKNRRVEFKILKID